eukprot:scaffold25132_cov51-Phaeocystis_antarctica.AAC.2
MTYADPAPSYEAGVAGAAGAARARRAWSVAGAADARHGIMIHEPPHERWGLVVCVDCLPSV